MQKQVYIHVGMPKTGTSFLQKYVYPHLEEIDYWRTFDHPSSYYLERVANSNFLTFDPSWKKKLRSLAEESPKDKILISFEGLFGSYSANYKSNYTNALILSEIFPDARILVTFRNQLSTIRSNYAQLVSEGYSGNILKYINYNKRLDTFDFQRIESNLSLNIQSLQYDRYIENYYTTFGKERVKVLFHEQMQIDLESFVRSITDFINVPALTIKQFSHEKKANSSLPCSGIWILRFINLFFVPKYGGNGLIQRTPYFGALQSRASSSIIFRVMAALSKMISPPLFVGFTRLIDKRQPVIIPSKVEDKLRLYYANSNKKSNELIESSNLEKLGY
ncbi:MAG: hypothetical protein GWP27_04400 [Bacteroidetes bacterium]|nr:hypothetical protein [Bacteroidota bacterium]